MKKLTSSTLALAMLASIVISGCYRVNKTSFGEESYEKKQRYGQYLKVQTMPTGTPLGTTQTHMSNVSWPTALAKMSQALNSYDSRKLPYNLSTVFHIATQQDGNTTAITGVVVQGHYYWVAPLDYVASKETAAAFAQTHGIVPAIAVVDAEDETRPAWLRFEDDLGHPYKITIRYQKQQFWDDSSIGTHLWNAGWKSNLSCKHLDTPTLEPDDHWRLFYAATWDQMDNCNSMSNGSEYYPDKLILVNAESGEIKSFQLDNPNTAENERDPIIDKEYGWVDQVYSSWLILRWAKRWGFNLNNYLKTSELDNLRADGNMVDQVMGADNKNVVFVLYMTSFLPDQSVVGVLIVNPQDGTGKYWKTNGSDGMATKSTAVQTVENAVHLRGLTGKFMVEDLTPHTIYGRLTWEGELVQPFSDSDGHEVGSHYSGTVLLEATDDLQPAHVIIEHKKHEAFTKYEDFLYLKRTNRVGSNVMEEATIEGVVSKIMPIVVSGDTSYLINLAGQEGLWEVKVGYIGDPMVEDVLDLKIGDRVFMRYADTRNRKTHLAREIQDLTHPGSALHPDVILNLPANAVPTRRN
jgi:hypothetical protein